MSDSIIRVLDKYDIQQLQSIESLGNAGGFSGAQFWKITTVEQVYCLRQWPAGKPGLQQSELIYATLAHLQEHTDLPLAFPIQLTSGTANRMQSKRQWELSSWLSGEPIGEVRISDTQLSAAIQTIATFHNCTEQLHRYHQASPAIDMRCRFIDRLWDGQLEKLRNSQSQVDPDLKQCLLDQFCYHSQALRQELQAVREVPVLLIPVIGDIWSDHLLFTGDQVTGVMDFGALKIDSPNLDIARMLGSYEDYRPGAMAKGLAFYNDFRTVSELDQSLIELYDRAYVVLAGMQWLIWIEIERRQFCDWFAVERRLKRLTRRAMDAL